MTPVEEAFDGNDAPEDLRSYGRRRGRKPSARQELLLRDVLPRVSIDPGRGPAIDPTRIFSAPVADIWIEIGFGGGEHLLWQAGQNPGVGIIGCEPFQDGVVKVLDALDRGGPCNIRLHAGDAREVIRRLPPSSLGRAFILFPDPWPKKRHVKRRLVNVALLRLLARAMRPGASLRLATDIGDYARTMLLAIREEGSFGWVASCAEDWRVRPGDWPATRYEAKAVAAGRCCYYLTLTRRGP